jgi:hypothetical protein
MSLASLKTALKPIVKQALISGGAALGTATGLPYGGQIGGVLGAHLSKFVGSGDYVANGLIRDKGYPPSRVTAKFKELGPGCIRIQHTEFIGEVFAPTTGFALTNYRINPGDSVTFPWLNNLAIAFERYKVLGMIVEYRPQASQYGNGNNALGKVMISAEYNVMSANFTSTRAMENSNECIVFRPCDVAAYGVECADLPYDQYYVRRPSTNAPDAALYDMCNIIVATNTPIINAPLGDLFITYDIVLDRPHLVDTSGEPGYVHLTALDMANAWVAGYYPLFSTVSARLYSAYVPQCPANNVLHVRLSGFNQYDVVMIVASFAQDSAGASSPWVLGAVSGVVSIVGFDQSTLTKLSLPNAATAAANTATGTVATFQITADPGAEQAVFSVTGSNGTPGIVSDVDIYVVKLFTHGGAYTTPL